MLWKAKEIIMDTSLKNPVHNYFLVKSKKNRNGEPLSLIMETRRIVSNMTAAISAKDESGNLIFDNQNMVFTFPERSYLSNPLILPIYNFSANSLLNISFFSDFNLISRAFIQIGTRSYGVFAFICILSAIMCAAFKFFINETRALYFVSICAITLVGILNDFWAIFVFSIFLSIYLQFFYSLYEHITNSMSPIQKKITFNMFSVLVPISCFVFMSKGILSLSITLLVMGFIISNMYSSVISTFQPYVLLIGSSFQLPFIVVIVSTVFHFAIHKTLIFVATGILFAGYYLLSASFNSNFQKNFSDFPENIVRQEGVFDGTNFDQELENNLKQKNVNIPVIVIGLYCIFYIVFLHLLSIPIETAFVSRLPVLPTTQYSFNWYQYPDIRLLNDVTFTNCPLCDFSPSNENANSSPRDVVMTMAMKKLTNIGPFLKTLRTTGSKAKVVIFTDYSTLEDYNDDVKELINNCSVIFVDVGPPVKKLDYNQVSMYRNILTIDYLAANEPAIDRVIMLDLYDSIIQTDPFTPEIRKDTLYLNKEGFYLKDNYFNMNWLRDVPWINITHVSQHETLCTGLIWGGAYQVSLLYKSYLSVFDAWELKCYTADQGFLNSVIYGGVIDKYTKNYKLVDAGAGYETIGTLFEHYRYTKLGDYHHPKTNVISKIIHQYDRDDALKRIIKKTCPRNNLNIKNYIRGLPD